MFVKVYRTARIKIEDQAFKEACLAQCLASKNLKNTGVFLVRNVLSCLDQETRNLKADLNTNQIEVLSYFNQSIRITNENRLVKNLDKQSKLTTLELLLAKGDVSKEEFDEQVKKLKPSKIFAEINAASSPQDFWAVLDDTVLDQLLRYRKDNEGQTPFQALPAKASEQVRKQIGAGFKSWLASLAGFKKSPANFTGVPRMPGYMDKDGLNPVKYFAGALGKSHLPTIEDRALFMDYNKSCALTVEGFEAYKSFDLIKALDQLRNQLSKDKRETAKLMELRIIPKGRAGGAGKAGNETFFLEGVFECLVEFRCNTFLEKLTAYALENELKEEDKQKYFYKQFEEQGLKVPAAGADLGLNNVITLSFNQGDAGVVVSNQRLEKKIKLFDEKIDKLKAALATPRQRELQKLQDEKPLVKLEKSEVIELRKLQKAMFEHVGLRQLMDDRQAWLKNALHTASCGVVDLLVSRKIEALVVGRNKGWKNESSLGKKINRRFQATAHGEFISMLRYKCEDAGILFLETEESYTSKTSFATGEVLKEYNINNANNAKSKRNTKESSDPANTNSLSTTNASTNMPDPRVEDAPVVLKAKKQNECIRKAVKGAKSKGLHQFTSQSVGCNLKRWTNIHADMNGAYNIIRKVVPTFCATNKLSSEFHLMWVSPTGLRAFKAKSNTNLSRKWTSGEHSNRVLSKVS
jgi:putative transposase